MKGYLFAMRDYFKSAGRASRRQYLSFALIGLVLIPFLTEVLALALGASNQVGQGVAMGVIALHIIPLFAVSIRRLHDFDRSTQWVLIMFLPLVNVLLILALCVWPPTPEENRYGSREDIGRKVYTTAERIEPAARSEPTGASLSIVEQLERLQVLRANDVLDEEEFAEMKAKLLGRIRS